MKKASSNVKNVMENFLSTANRQDESESLAVTDEPVSQSEVLSAAQKPPRITISLTKENLDYLQTISRVNGMSIAKYINKLVDHDKIAKEDLYVETRELLNKIND